MKRDNDYIRQLLFEMEASEGYGFDASKGFSNRVAIKRVYHMELLCDAGLAKDLNHGFHRLTNAGHDFLDAMRDEGVWQRTKDTIATAGGNATLDILKQIALGYLKTQIKEKTGVELK